MDLPTDPSEVNQKALRTWIRETYEVGRGYDGRPVAIDRTARWPYLLDTPEGRAGWHVDVLRTHRWGRDAGVPYDDLETTVAAVLGTLAHEAEKDGSTITSLLGVWGRVLAEADARGLNRRDLVQDFLQESRRLVARRMAQQEEDLREVGDKKVGVILSVAEASLHYADTAGRYLLPGLMPRQGTGTIFGPSGAAKTLAYLYRDLCLANQRPFFGVEPPAKFGSIVVPLEDAGSIHLRLIGAADRHGMSTEGILIIGDPMVTALNASMIDKFFAEVLLPAKSRLEAAGFPLGVVTFDTQRQLIPGESLSDDRTTSMVSKLLARVSMELCCVGEVASHTPLSDELRQAGSQEQKGSRDYEWSVRASALHLAKLKNGEPHKVGHFRTEGRLVDLSPRPAPTGAAPVAFHEPDEVEIPVLVEISEIEAAVSAELSDTGVLVIDEAFAESARDRTTAVELLRILSGPWPLPESAKAADKKIGWNNADLAKALEGLASRPEEDGGPRDVHTTKRFYAAVLDSLHGEGLIVERNKAWKNGLARAWDLTEDGQIAFKALSEVSR